MVLTLITRPSCSCFLKGLHRDSLSCGAMSQIILFFGDGIRDGARLRGIETLKT